MNINSKDFLVSKDFNAESPKVNNKSFSGYENEARPLYMKDTFNSKISKNLSNKKLETIEQNKITHKSIRKSPKKVPSSMLNSPKNL